MSRYEWTSGWAELPQEPIGWMHSGIAVADDGVVVAHPGEPTLLVYDLDGTLAREIPVPGLLEPHGFRAVADGLWIGDVGFKRRVRGPDFETERRPGRVVLVDEDGRVIREIRDPGSGWSPTSIAVDGDSGDLWVADGYGNSLVHRFDADGTHRQTLTGEEGAGRFSCPHGIVVDRRRGRPALYVSDRANARIQVFDPDGRFSRVVGEGIVVTPTDMAVVGDLLAVTDFTQARLTLLDCNDALVEHVGADPSAPERDGWPNARDGSGDLERPSLEPGKFNSPHTVTSDGSGNLFVTEWLLGGRLTKLAKKRSESDP
jgi:DNA-binding beta-propeller fold protein YncE